MIFLEKIFPFKGSVADQQSYLKTQDLFCYDDLADNSIFARFVDQVEHQVASIKQQEPQVAAEAPEVIEDLNVDMQAAIQCLKQHFLLSIEDPLEIQNSHFAQRLCD